MKHNRCQCGAFKMKEATFCVTCWTKRRRFLLGISPPNFSVIGLLDGEEIPLGLTLTEEEARKLMETALERSPVKPLRVEIRKYGTKEVVALGERV